MSIFKTEVDSKIVTNHEAVVRSEMEFDEAKKQHLPGFDPFSHMNVVNTHPGAVRRKSSNG